jgi:cell division protein FtsW
MAITWPRSIQALRRDELTGRIDGWVLGTAVALVAFGVVMVASSSMPATGEGAVAPFRPLLKHLVFLGLGSSLALMLMATPLHRLEQQSRMLMLLGVLLLLAVFVPGVGRRVNGARRWINLGVTSFQAVEAVKLLLIIYLASYLKRFGAQVERSMLGIVKPLGVAAFVVLLLLVQPDFGSAMLLVVTVVGMIWLAGARLRHLGALAAFGVPVIALAAIAEPYRVRRLTSFLDPFADPFNDGFQLSQALIAIGRGDWFGVGLGASVEKLFYLPEANSDFIFAVIAEELGFAGIIAVLLLFALLCGRAFKIGLRAFDAGLPFAALLAFGLALLIGTQALVSIGVNLGVLPTKGLTLPLISTGGSSVLMTCAAIGLLLRVGFEVTRREAELKLEVPLEVAA